MSMKEDGGPAFPAIHYSDAGMTLRDYFAIHAPEPSQAAIDFEAESDRLKNPHGDAYKPERRAYGRIRADLRYKFADAMLSARYHDE